MTGIVCAADYSEEEQEEVAAPPTAAEAVAVEGNKVAIWGEGVCMCCSCLYKYRMLTRWLA